MNQRLTALVQGMKEGKGYVLTHHEGGGAGVSPKGGKVGKNLFGPGSTDHEKQAAKDGFVPSCCGSAANTKLQG